MMKLNNQNQKKLLYVVKGINGCCILPLEEWIKWLLYPNERSTSHKNIYILKHDNVKYPGIVYFKNKEDVIKALHMLNDEDLNNLF